MSRALFLALLVVAAQAVHLDFSKGLDGWEHSEESKWVGRFVAEVPASLEKKALKVPDKAKHYGISTVLKKAVDPAKDLVLQYDLKLGNGLSCGGAYIKFVTADTAFTPKGLKDDTPYTVMFGADKCGDTNKVHLILRHKSSKTGKVEEKHLKSPPFVETDTKTHVYTAILRASNNSYAVLVDGEEKKAGSLFEDFEPSINPPETIPDPEDKKPADWVDEARIPDPDAKKPEDWDEDAPMEIPDEDAKKPEGWLDEEPAEVDDPDAKKPEDWDEEEDGDWEAPKIANPKCEKGPGCGEWKRPNKPNPAYKGKWSAPMIDNPAYKGVWKPREIPNPDHVKDPAPLTNIGKVGAAAIEIWTMDDGYFFDNIVISNDVAEAEKVRAKTWEPKKKIEDKLEEEERKKAEKEAAKAAEKEGSKDDGEDKEGGEEEKKEDKEEEEDTYADEL
ncbi:calnexin-like protein 1-like [Chlorella sorokiniana]|uniref:Calnexin-like protein 1-like n=1 Tax=Chlorella sorokiniana TaxID=3076 RepID=A0A2P6TZZ6_CHLSO|nr:calnexin-like protein 1-like [Chlorella sorokiniana]|eukprot:PRW59639.1 calnexin-like protein 1-like [Chlorella sorokiniana]